jgi:putative hydrolase of the HAD superfamily
MILLRGDAFLINKVEQRAGVVFDGDDTLWVTEPLYDQARARARRVVTSAGADGEEWEALQRQIDVKNVLTLGYGSERFPTSSMQAYERLCKRHHMKADAAVVARIRDAARTVFVRNPALVPGVRRVLIALRKGGVRLALLTKGDRSVQRRRIESSGLRELFHVIRIVNEKSAAGIRAVVKDLGVPRHMAVMVGNSVRSDILPALSAGIHAIWIKRHVWEYEREHDHLVGNRVVVVSDIKDVPSAVFGVCQSEARRAERQSRRRSSAARSVMP